MERFPSTGSEDAVACSTMFSPALQVERIRRQPLAIEPRRQGGLAGMSRACDPLQVLRDAHPLLCHAVFA